MKKKREVLYTTKEVLHYIHSVIDDCASMVCPEPHVEEERSCEQVADQIRSLKKRWKDSEYVLRTTADENLWKRKYVLLDKEVRTRREEQELERINRKIMSFRTARHPDDAKDMDIIRRASKLIKEKGYDQIASKES
jgi:hypothetical protein